MIYVPHGTLPPPLKLFPPPGIARMASPFGAEGRLPPDEVLQPPHDLSGGRQERSEPSAPGGETRTEGARLA